MEQGTQAQGTGSQTQNKSVDENVAMNGNTMPSEKAEEKKMNLLHILLVEDDDVDIMTLQRAFKRNNITNPLHIALNGIEALDMLRGTNGKEKILPQPRIILLDINMPQMNGLEFLKELRADPALRHISVFVLTTSNDDKDRVEAYNFNVAGYIIKPVTFENFVVAVATLNKFWSLCEQP